MISLFQKTFFSLLCISVFSVYASANEFVISSSYQRDQREPVTTTSVTSSVLKNDKKTLSGIIAEKFRFSTPSSLYIDSLLQGLSLTTCAIAVHDLCFANGTVDHRRFAVGLSALSLYGIVHGYNGVSEIYIEKYSDTARTPAEEIITIMNKSCYRGYATGVAGALAIIALSN